MSDQTPYQPPQEASALDVGGNLEPVRRVARYQRWVIFALLFNIGINVLSLVTTFGQLPIPQALILLLGLGGMVFAIVSIFLLAKEISGAALGVICALLMIVPCISLITLLVINQKATSFLQSRGVRVGFFGTNPDSI